MRKREFSLTSIFLLLLILHFAECDFFRVQRLRNRSGVRLQQESRSNERAINHASRIRAQYPDQRRVDVKVDSFRRYEAEPTTKMIRNMIRSLDGNNREIRRMNRENRKTFRISEYGRTTPEVEGSFRKLIAKPTKSEEDLIFSSKNNRRNSRSVDRVLEDRRSLNSRTSFLANRRTLDSRNHRNLLHFMKNTLLRQTFRFVPNYGKETGRKTFRNNDPMFVGESRRKTQSASRNNLFSRRNSDLKRNTFEFQSRILAREIAREREGVMMKTKRELKILYETRNLNGKSISPEDHAFRNRIIAKRVSENRYREGLTEERVYGLRHSRRHVLSTRMLRETTNSRVFKFDKSRRDLTLFKYARKNERSSKLLLSVRASRIIDAIHSRVNSKIEKYQTQGSENKYSVRDSRSPMATIKDSHKIVRNSRNLSNTQRNELSERVSHNSADRRLNTDTLDSRNTVLTKNIRSRIAEKDLTIRQMERNVRNNRDSRSFERTGLDTRSTSRRFMSVVRHVLSTSRNTDQRYKMRSNSERRMRINERDNHSFSRNSRLKRRNNQNDALSFRKVSNSAENNAKHARVDPTENMLRLGYRRFQTRIQSILPSSFKLETNRRFEQLHRTASSSRVSRRIGTTSEVTDSSRESQRNVINSILPKASRIIRNNRLELSEILRVSSLRKSSYQDGRLPTSFSRDRKANKMNSRSSEPFKTSEHSINSRKNNDKVNKDQKSSSSFEILSELMHHVINRDNKYISFAFDAFFGLLFLVVLMDEPNKGLFSRFKSHLDEGIRIFQNWSIKV